jgi:disulfide bond formation protein DsbB
MTDTSPNAPKPSDTSGLVPALVFFISVMVVLFLLMIARAPAQEAAVETAIARAFTATPTATETPPPTNTPEPSPTSAPTDAAAAPAEGAMGGSEGGGLLTSHITDPERVSRGNGTYRMVCASCHSPTGAGIPGLGLPLIGSEFVNTRSDNQLLQFIIEGRKVGDPANSTGVMMPARGGNPSLTDDDLVDVIHYIRSLNPEVQPPADDGSVIVPTLPPQPTSSVTNTPAPTIEFVPLMVLPTATPRDAAPVPTAAVGADAAALYGRTGQALYQGACATCHGADGRGSATVSYSLAESELLRNRDAIRLQNLFLIEGFNTTGTFRHPFRNGAPPLSDQQLLDIIVYLYTLPLD